MVDASAIYTVVSRPGPVESRLLAAIAPRVHARRVVGGRVSLRVLEGTQTFAAATLPKLVFLHGRGHAATIWARFLTHFSATCPTLAYDLPGFGHSGAPRLAGDDARSALDFFARPIESALESAGEVVLVGHSLGGLVALELALAGRVKVRGLVLIAAMGLSPYVTPSARLYLRVGPERIARATQLLHLPSRGLSNGALPDELSALRAELQTAPGGRVLAKRAFDALVPLTRGAISFQPRLAEVPVPVLLVWGNADEAFPLPIAMEAEARFPHARLELLSAGHSPHLSHAAQVIGAIETFLRDDVHVAR